MGYHHILSTYFSLLPPPSLPPSPPKNQAMLTSKGVRPKASMTSQLASVGWEFPFVAHLQGMKVDSYHGPMVMMWRIFFFHGQKYQPVS